MSPMAPVPVEAIVIVLAASFGVIVTLEPAVRTDARSSRTSSSVTPPAASPVLDV